MSHCRSSTPTVFLGKAVLKICSKFTGEHPCRSVITIEITPHHGCSPVNLREHIFRKAFPNNTSGSLLLSLEIRHLLKVY